MLICGSAMASLYICKWELSVFSMMTGLIAEMLLLLFFVCNAVKCAEHSQKQSIMATTKATSPSSQ